MDNNLENKKKKIMEVISSILDKNIDDFNKASQDFLPEWDSLNHAQIVFSIEDEFDIELTQEQMINIKSATDILMIINNEK